MIREIIEMAEQRKWPPTIADLAKGRIRYSIIDDRHVLYYRKWTTSPPYEEYFQIIATGDSYEEALIMRDWGMALEEDKRRPYEWDQLRKALAIYDEE